MKMMNKRKIKAHKGGRSERVAARVTMEEKKMIRRAAKKHGLTITEWLLKKANEDCTDEVT